MPGRVRPMTNRKKDYKRKMTSKLMSSEKRQTEKRQPTKKQTKKRKMNKYMIAKEKARKSNNGKGAESFVYNGTTYVRAVTKTGMVIYKRA